MSDYEGFGPAVAETASTDDDPEHTDLWLYSGDGDQPAPVWASSQRLREVIDRQQAMPPAADRRLLADEVQRQLPTLGLFRAVARLITGPQDRRAELSLYLLVFPGQARDNTGLKDLNDKVLGQGIALEYVTARQEEIRSIFTTADGASGPHYVTVGQDFKTASVVAVGKTPQEFAADLMRLDDRLRDRLLECLSKAEPDADAARRQEIVKLRRTLEKSKRDKRHYWFDIAYGTNTLSLRGSKAIDLTFRLVTEAAKGAAMARFAAKGQTVRSTIAKRYARGRGVDQPVKGHDPRGRAFRPDTFHRVLATANDLKKLMTQPYDPSQGDYRHMLVDKVWTTCFVRHQRAHFGNPDLIHDVRKKLLQPPAIDEGVKPNFAAHKELLELWLVTVNAIDFVKDFVATEYPREVNAYHIQGLSILEELLDQTRPVEWPRLVRFLTHDIRARHPVPQSRAASEFQFYCFAADHPDMMFFIMDVRGLGAALMAHYEAAQMTIVDEKLEGHDLVGETLQATDVVVQRRRTTYERVVAVFRKYYPQAAEAGARAQAATAFGTPAAASGAMPHFARSLQVMLGGDEVFVAAHPYYASCEHLIIADLSREFVQDQPLNLRTAVAYSSAARSGGTAQPAPTVGDGQRRVNQLAHDRAFKLAADSLTALKPLERRHRRIERLIELLEANEKKKDKAPPYRAKLDDLHLMEVYARVKRRRAKAVAPAQYARLRRALLAGDPRTAGGTGLFELVDFTGTVVDPQQLDQRAQALEAAVRRDVGLGNFHAEPLPAPRWLKKIIDLMPKRA